MGIEKFFGEKASGFGSSVYDASRNIGKNLVYGVAGLAAVCGVAVANPGDARGGSVLEEIFKGALVDQTAREIVKSGSDNGGANVVVNNCGEPGTYNIDGTSAGIIKQLGRIRFVMPLDIDGDGVLDWIYNDGESNRYSAEITLENEGCNINEARKSNKEKIKAEKCFSYYKNHVLVPVPENTQILLYANPSANSD